MLRGMAPSFIEDPRFVAARAAVVAAARVTRAVQSALTQAGALEKDDRSPVTVADYTAQALVAHVLEAHLGPVRLVGEEDADALRAEDNRGLLEQCLRYAEPEWAGVQAAAFLEALDRGAQDPAAEGFWTLDPVDGTKGFLRGEHYAVSLAWIEGGVVQLGVLGCPNLDLDPRRDVSNHGAGVFGAAALGGGAYVFGPEPDAAMRPASVGPRGGEALRVCESVEKRHSNFDAHAEILGKAGFTSQSVRIDSQAKYLLVARDQADVYLRLPSTKGYVEKIWDHAAGALVATEAGLEVRDFSGGALDFSKGRRLEANRGVLVARPEDSARLLTAIRELGFDG